MKTIDNPTELYVGYGTCINVSKSIWWPPVIEKSNFLPLRQYTDQVQAEIGFQCVIIARFDWGVLFIDMCDGANWEIPEINEPHYYLKMQYNPNHNYKHNVFPFTYVPQNLHQFDNTIEKYAELYKNTFKSNLAYGRWDANSIDRYNIAHKMRELGIMIGGEYCGVPKGQGYDDHEEMGILDPIKPREKMPLDEYMKFQCSAHACIDAGGFGDFTHRMIENFGLGIPVIRPKLNNVTINPIIDGIHYLDCGHSGEKLKECLIQIQDMDLRSKIINSASDWYAQNASKVGIYNLIISIVNDSVENKYKDRIFHIYQDPSFGEDWFTYPELYKEIVSSAKDESHFVEIGCWKGKSTAFLATEIANSKKNIRFDCIDTWEGSPEHGGQYKNNDTLYDLFLDNMKTLTEWFNPIREDSRTAHKQYQDNSLDFVFLDADHSYESVKEDIVNWLPKIKKGGIFAGHDYTNGWPGVVKAVDEILGKDKITSKYSCWIYKNN